MAQSCHVAPPKWYQEKLFVAAAVSVSAVFASSQFAFSQALLGHFIDYVKLVFWPVSIGLILGGVIDYLVPREYVEQLLSQPKKRTLVVAVGLGFLFSACCHGILAIAIQLYKKGASVSSIMAFLLAAPWANLSATFLLFGFFGWKALVLIGVAMVVALVTGWIFQWRERSNQREVPRMGRGEIWRDIQRRWGAYRVSWGQIVGDAKGVMRGTWMLSRMVLWWIVIGMVLAAMVGTFVPGHVMMTYMGPSLSGVSLTLLLATVLEVCSEGTAPLAFEVYTHTRALGNVLVFLMAGVATDYTEIGLIWKNMGWKTAVMLPIIAVPQIIFWGVLINMVLPG